MLQYENLVKTDLLSISGKMIKYKKKVIKVEKSKFATQ